MLDGALGDLQAAIEQSDARVTHDPLPIVSADASQLGQVFQKGTIYFTTRHVGRDRGQRRFTGAVVSGSSLAALVSLARFKPLDKPLCS